jgi:hypothetical protein
VYSNPKNCFKNRCLLALRGRPAAEGKGIAEAKEALEHAYHRFSTVAPKNRINTISPAFLFPKEKSIRLFYHFNPRGPAKTQDR